MRIKQKLVFIQMSLTTYNRKTKEILHTILDKCKISITFEIWCVYFAAKENDRSFNFVLFIISMSQFEILNLQSMFGRIKHNLQYCETFWKTYEFDWVLVWETINRKCQKFKDKINFQKKSVDFHGLMSLSLK